MKKYILNNQRTLVLREKKTIYTSLKDLYINLNKHLIIGTDTLNLHLRS